MRLRPLFLTLVTVTAFGLGGLNAGSQDAGDAAPTSGSAYTPPPTPAVSGAQTVAELEHFVDTYPERRLNKPDHVGARDLIDGEFTAAGLSVWRQNFNIGGVTYQNVCAAQFGVLNDEIWVVVGGHYDTISQEANAGLSSAPLHAVSQGAYDNGAGTRLMMTLAKAWAASVDPAYSILFCAFDREEEGLQGSREVKRAMDGTQSSTTTAFPWPVQETRAMLNMDMFGINWPVRAPIYCTTAHSQDLRDWIEAARVAEGVPDDMFRFSGITIGPTNIVLGTTDHVHWQNAGIPVAFFISDFSELGVPGTATAPTAPVPTVPGAYPFWHVSDTMETLDAMAGGRDAAIAGFQTAANIGAETLAAMSLHPELAM